MYTNKNRRRKIRFNIYDYINIFWLTLIPIIVISGIIYISYTEKTYNINYTAYLKSFGFSNTTMELEEFNLNIMDDSLNCNCVVESEVEESDNSEYSGYLGEFMITSYCACEECCGKTDGITATGTIATEGRTIAVDPDVIPYGTHIIINGNEYIAEDCGGAINGNHIDMFIDSHERALNYGVYYADVYIVN